MEERQEGCGDLRSAEAFEDGEGSLGTPHQRTKALIEGRYPNALLLEDHTTLLHYEIPSQPHFLLRIGIS